MSDVLLYATTLGTETILAVDAHELEERVDGFKPHLGKALAAELRLLAPFGKGRLRSGVRYVVTATGLRVGVFGIPYARARDRGAYIVADDARVRESGHAAALRFPGAGGETVFRRATRQEGTHYFEHALSAAPGTIESLYDRQFDLDDAVA